MVKPSVCDPTWQNCGVYAKSLRKENVVHAQEHGAVWITVRLHPWVIIGVAGGAAA
ncbi:DUF3105 domain-containing protein [Acrocarpospora sp. B8E8]|uniref:DUF3105 domain-containing protein n=1 Tax=Acrocarpospora sp. B8E8 TaxID=3153572 RepID=UPI00325DD258